MTFFVTESELEAAAVALPPKLMSGKVRVRDAEKLAEVVR